MLSVLINEFYLVGYLLPARLELRHLYLYPAGTYDVPLVSVFPLSPLQQTNGSDAAPGKHMWFTRGILPCQHFGARVRADGKQARLEHFKIRPSQKQVS